MIVQNVGHGGATDLSFTVPQVELGKAKRIARAGRPRARRARADDRCVASPRCSIVGAGLHNAPGLRGPDVRHARRRRRQHRDDLDLGGPDHLHHRRGRARDGRCAPCTPRSSWSGPEPVEVAACRLSRPAPHPPMPEFLARQERFAVVGSTNDVVRGWLADGTPEVCLAVADEQTAGRGRDGRTWVAPPGAALLLSLGFRPDWLAPDRAWRLAATVSLAMADAPRTVAGLPDGHDPPQVAERPRRRDGRSAALRRPRRAQAGRRPRRDRRPRHATTRASSSASASNADWPAGRLPARAGRRR